MLKSFLTTLLVLLLVVTFIVVTQQHPIKNKEQTAISLSTFKLPPLPTDEDPVPDFTKYKDVSVKKEAFFAYLLPEIRRQNTIIAIERKAVLALYELYKLEQSYNSKQNAVLAYLLKKYTVEFEPLSHAVFEELLVKVDVIPEALVLVQAAIESGWGTSRFAKKGYNFFGLWCFKQGCGFVPKRRDDEAVHEVAKFNDLSHAVMTYLRNINRLYAYEDLRELRTNYKLKGNKVTAEALTSGLMSYSERGQEYIDELLNMLRVNRKYMGLDS